MQKQSATHCVAKSLWLYNCYVSDLVRPSCYEAHYNIDDIVVSTIDTATHPVICNHGSFGAILAKSRYNEAQQCGDLFQSNQKKTSSILAGKCKITQISLAADGILKMLVQGTTRKMLIKLQHCTQALICPSPQFKGPWLLEGSKIFKFINMHKGPREALKPKVFNTSLGP